MAVFCWIALGALIYIYAGYPALVWCFSRLFGRMPARKPITPPVSLLIPAFNEEAHIEARLRNSLALDYPKEQLEIVVASDGSTDATNAMVARFESQGIKLMAMPENIGKSAMLTAVVPQLKGEIVVLSDASSELEPGALRELVQDFADPEVGCVSGLYRLKSTGGDLRGEGEGLYWRYETFLKKQESRLHSILGAHGAFYAIRKSLFRPLEHASINDDYLIAMRIVEQGFRAVYEPRAVAWERDLASVEGEFARRRRIAVGNCQQIIELKHLLNPLRGWIALTFFSHKVLRTAAPVFLLLLLATSFMLPSAQAAVLVSLQLLFYGAALLGYFCQRRGKTGKLLAVPLYFCLGNLAMLAGLLKFCFSSQRYTWERSR